MFRDSKQAIFKLHIMNCTSTSYACCKHKGLDLMNYTLSSLSFVENLLKHFQASRHLNAECSILSCFENMRCRRVLMLCQYSEVLSFLMTYFAPLLMINEFMHISCLYVMYIVYALSKKKIVKECYGNKLASCYNKLRPDN